MPRESTKKNPSSESELIAFLRTENSELKKQNLEQQKELRAHQKVLETKKVKITHLDEQRFFDYFPKP